MTQASLVDLATLKQHRWTVVTQTEWSGGKPDGSDWLLLDPDGDPRFVGDYGCVSPTKWEAVAEGLRRIADESPEGSEAIGGGR